jgi:hypothetical protein
MTAGSRSTSIAASVVFAMCGLIATRAQAPAPPTIAELLGRTADYVKDYEAKFSAVVSEEHYRQIQDRSRGITLEKNLKSDVLVLNAGAGGWMGFRDVFEVDGRPVRDHEQRLMKLFVDGAADTMAHARQIADESARYNLGSVRRNINVPTMALAYIRAENQSRSRFSLDGTAKVEGVETVVLAFTEVARPSLIRSGDADAVATGRVWIQPDGHIVRTQLKLAPSQLVATITVTYGTAPKLDLRVPLQMSEIYKSSSGESITGSASYTNFRRFNVDVATTIKK